MATSPKTRDYMITINEGAQCYETALDIVKEMKVKLYALIVHDKDLEFNQETGVIDKPKKTHKHLILELVNPLSFNSMLNKFKGAHIEPIKYKKAAYQYLIHNRPAAKDKYQYAIENILSNNINAVKEAITAEEGLRMFNEREFLRYIAEGITTPYQFTRTFGLNVYKQFWRAYNDMLACAQTDEQMRSDIEEIRKLMADIPF